MDDDIVTRASAVRNGRTKGQIDYLVDVGQWVRLRDGIYCPRAALDTVSSERARHRLLVLAAQRCLRDESVASMWSAARLHGLPVPPTCDHEVELTRETSRVRRYPGLHVRVAALPPDHLASLDGVIATSAARTVVDLARNLPLIDGVVVADAALHQGLTTKVDLVSVVKTCRRWPGAAQARGVVEFADGGAESPLESRSRVRLVRDLGLPTPELNVVIPGRDGRPLARVDMYWPEYRTIGEADGAMKYGGGASTLFREKLREDDLRDLDYQFVRWTWWDMEGRAIQVVARIRRAFARYAA
ncbi:MAG: hypothetical protein GEV10_03590 [Streptosporangiales bacterium]|nr:hypothetical protein [Streptosporangiales bacterium]